MKKLIAVSMISMLAVFTLAACGDGDENTGSTGSLPSENVNDNSNGNDEYNENDNSNANDENNGNDNSNANDENNGNANEIEIGEGENIMEAEGLSFATEAEIDGETLTVTMKLTNETDDVKQVEFSSGQQFDVFVTDENGNQLYHFAEGKMFTQALIMEEIKPGESLTFQDVWTSEKVASAGELTIDTNLLIYAINGQPMDLISFKNRVKVQ